MFCEVAYKNIWVTSPNFCFVAVTEKLEAEVDLYVAFKYSLVTISPPLSGKYKVLLAVWVSNDLIVVL